MDRRFAPRALIFDCDGTLVNSLPVYAEAWKQAFGSVGVPMESSWYFERVGLSALSLVQAMQAHTGREISSDVVLSELKANMMRNIDKIEEIPSIANLARRGKGHVPMAVASGGGKDIVHRSLVTVGLMDLFAVVVTIEDVKRPKPSPDLFLAAAERLKVPSADCLVFEDSNEGLEAASAAGIPAVDVRKMQDFRDDALFDLASL